MKIDLDQEIQRLEMMQTKLQRLLNLQAEVMRLQLELMPESVTKDQVLSIQKRVCESFGVNMAQLCSRSRSADVVEPRHVLCWLLTAAGLEQGRIAQLLGRDHSTISHGVDRIQERMDTDEKFRHRVNALQASLLPTNGHEPSGDLRIA